MLKGISKLLTGELLQALCDMGHGDEMIIADANFPAGTVAKRLIRCPGIDAATLLREIATVFPLDTYVAEPAAVLDLTESDIKKGMPEPVIWQEFTDILQKEYGKDVQLGKIERFEFYKRAEKAYVVIQSGEERQYGDLLLVKGVVV